jgi:Uma2 family endonuclease
MATRPRFTAEDLWRLPRIAGRRELVDGDIVAMAPVGALHAWIAGKVALHLGRHVEARGGGHVLAGDLGCVLALPSDPERVRAPDVAFVSAARLPAGRLPAKFLPGAPDLAVEVLSPSDTAADVEQRVRDWLDGGSRLVWVLAPASRTATVYRPDGSARLLREPESIDGEDVLPGLSIPLFALFE